MVAVVVVAGKRANSVRKVQIISSSMHDNNCATIPHRFYERYLNAITQEDAFEG
jgi:hypothetical protein